MPFTTTNLQVVQCDVPDCGTFRYFIGPKELQGTGWLEVYRLGDDGTHRKQYVCPEHAALLRLKDEWKTPILRFDDSSALQTFIDKGANTFRAQLDSGDLSTKKLLKDSGDK
jgi:hypothetical protein